MPLFAVDEPNVPTTCTEINSNKCPRIKQEDACDYKRLLYRRIFDVASMEY